MSKESFNKYCKNCINPKRISIKYCVRCEKGKWNNFHKPYEIEKENDCGNCMTKDCDECLIDKK